MVHSYTMMRSPTPNCVACDKSTNGGNHECSVCGLIVHNWAFSYDASLLGGNKVEYCSVASTEMEDVVTCKSLSNNLRCNIFLC